MLIQKVKLHIDGTLQACIGHTNSSDFKNNHKYLIINLGAINNQDEVSYRFK